MLLGHKRTALTTDWVVGLFGFIGVDTSFLYALQNPASATSTPTVSSSAVMRCHRNHLSQYIFIFGILQKSIPAISPSVHGAPIIPPSLFVTVIVRMRLLTVLFHVAVVMTSSPQNCHWLEGTEVLVNMFCCTENHDASFNSLIHKTFFTALKMTAD